MKNKNNLLYAIVIIVLIIILGEIMVQMEALLH